MGYYLPLLGEGGLKEGGSAVMQEGATGCRGHRVEYGVVPCLSTGVTERLYLGD